MGLTSEDLDTLDERIEAIENEREEVEPGPASMAAEAHHIGRITALVWVQETFGEDTGEAGE